jgi:hypothetical protein
MSKKQLPVPAKQNHPRRNTPSPVTVQKRGVLASALRPLTRSLDQLMEEADFRGDNFQVKVTSGSTELRLELEQARDDRGKRFSLEVEDLP